MLGVAVLLMLFVSAIISVLTMVLSTFANKIGIEIADRLFVHYLKQNWLYHVSTNSSGLQKIAVELIE